MIYDHQRSPKDVLQYVQCVCILGPVRNWSLITGRGGGYKTGGGQVRFYPYEIRGGGQKRF